MTNRLPQPILQLVIVLLALADGTIHLLLDFVLFRGRLIGSPFSGTPRPPAGGPRPGPAPLALPRPLNELFLLNFVGEVVLVLLFLFSRRLLGERRWLIDIGMIAYAAATFIGWWLFGRPNPMGLGYLSKGIEIALIVFLLVDLWSIFRSRVVSQPVAAEGQRGA